MQNVLKTWGGGAQNNVADCVIGFFTPSLSTIQVYNNTYVSVYLKEDISSLLYLLKTIIF